MSIRMDNQNLFMVNKHNRRITQRAFKHSIINTTYVFPKQISQCNDTSDMCSLQSRVSQRYDLNHQNLRHNRFDQISRKIIPITALLKTKRAQQSQQQSTGISTKVTFNVSKDSLNRQMKTKRKYLSLTPKKQSLATRQTVKSSQKTVGISLTKRNNQTTLLKSNTERISQYNTPKIYLTSAFGEGFFNDIKRVASRCLGNDNKELNSESNNQAIFDNIQLDGTKQTVIRTTKIPISAATEDTTPFNSSRRKRMLEVSRHPLHQEVYITPFSYS